MYVRIRTWQRRTTKNYYCGLIITGCEPGKRVRIYTLFLRERHFFGGDREEEDDTVFDCKAVFEGKGVRGSKTLPFEVFFT